MKLIRVLYLLSVGLLLASLAGCAELNIDLDVDIHEEIWLNTDGSGKVHYEMGVGEALASWLEKEVPEFDEKRLYDPVKIESNNPYIKNMVTNLISDGGKRCFTVDYEVTDFEKAFPTVSSSKSVYNYSIEKMSNGHKQFHHSLDFRTLIPAEEDSLDLSGITGKMLANHYWTVTLHADHIVSTNGVWNQENKVVVWRIPLSQLVERQGLYDLVAEYEPPFPVWVLVGIGLVFVAGLILVVIVALILILALRRPKVQDRPLSPTQPVHPTR